MQLDATIGWGSAAAYAGALLLAVATPGPAMFTVIGTGLSRGPRPAAAIGLGIAVGDVLLVAAALLGLAALIDSAEWMLSVIQYGGALYLLYTGIRLWRSIPVTASREAMAGQGLFGSSAPGLAVALSNPKAMLFHASLMPLLLNVRRVSWADAGIIFIIVAAVNLLAMGGYALLAGRASHWFRSSARVRRLNRICGGAIAATAILIACR
jgi:threonine/homoserine/homoserine lactone efflux protein